jgi:thioesterase domain-containing protein
MFFSLANLLGSGQPFLGVPAPDVAALRTPYRLEDYAAAQVQSIRRIQAEGPYCLGGWSASAVAAYEVAQQLRAQGQEVSLLVLFDGINPAAFQDLALQERLKGRISRTAARVRFHASNLARGGVGNLLPYLQDRWKWLRLLSRIRAWSVSYLVHQRLGRHLPRWMQNPDDILIHCFYQYRPEPYRGRVLLFRHGSRSKGTPGDPLLGWGGFFTGRFEVCEVPGTHRGIFEEPNVRVMSEKLSESLLDVQKSYRLDRAKP